jgi:hypothetical protein
MRRYNFFQPLWMAFYSRPLYRDITQNWRWLSFLYLLFLVAVCYLPLAVSTQTSITHMVNAIKPWITQLPTITITNGEVSIDQPVPFLIKDPKSSQVVAIIDTSNTITSFQNTTATLLLTKDKLLVKNNDEIKTYDLSGIKNRTYDQERINSFLPILHYAILFIYPVAVLLYFLQGVCEALFYAVLVKLFIDTELPYKTLCCLAAVALTPKFILVSLLGIFSISFPYKWIIYFALGLGYLFFAVGANLESEHLPEKK